MTLRIFFALIFLAFVCQPASAQNKTQVALTGLDTAGRIATTIILTRSAERQTDRIATSAERIESIRSCTIIIAEAMRSGGQVPDYCRTPSSGIELGYRENRERPATAASGGTFYSEARKGPLFKGR